MTYLLRTDHHEERTSLPFEDVLGLSRLLAVSLDAKVAIHRASDGKKLAVSGVGVTPRDVGMGAGKTWQPNPKKRRRRRR